MSPDSPVLPSHPFPASLRRDSAVVALGVAFLAAAIVVSAVNSRPEGDLDLSNFAVGLLATAGLLGAAGLAWTAVRDEAGRANLIVWPAAFGALGAGLMIAVGFDASDLSIYLAALVVIGLSAGAYVLAPGGALAISGLVGLLVLYAKLVDDLVNVDDFDSGFIVAGVVVFLFTATITGLGWLLPDTRALTGVVVGTFAVTSYLSIMASIAFTRAFTGALSSPSLAEDDPFSDDFFTETDTYTNDVYVTLFFAALLVGVWVVAAYLTHSPGFKVLIVAMIATVVPAATVALALEHPGWWGLATAIIGLAVLSLVVVRSTGGTRGPGAPTSAPPAAPAFPPPSSPPPPPPVG